MKFDPFYIIKKPILTEKTNRIGQESKCYVFEVDPRATKTQIRAAIPLLFGSDIKVKKVNTVNVKPRKRRAFRAGGKQVGTTRHYKKAFVTLAADSKELDLI